MASDTPLLKSLDQRRRELGLTYDQVAKRSGVSRPTVQRILSGRHTEASFANIVAIAESLGLGVRFESQIDARTLRRQQAERKAKSLIALVQGTSGLEGQAIDGATAGAMVEQTTHELLAGSKRKLWSDG